MVGTATESDRDQVSVSGSVKSPVGSKIFKLLMAISFIGIFAYMIIFVGINPVQANPNHVDISPDNVGKLTIVMNTFKRHDMMTG
jgi:bacteriorhodopsin